MTRAVHACLLILVLASFGLAQPPQKGERELWLARAQNFTSDLLKDGADLSSMERAVLWVRLARYWWREDPKRARMWIASAVDAVEQTPSKETPNESRERLETAQIILTLVTPLDQKLTERLLTVLGADKSDDKSTGTANALVDAAIVIAETNPKRAAELGAQAMRIGQPYNLEPLLSRIRAQDPKLADALFAQALPIARQSPGGMVANVLTYVAFPAQRGRYGDISVPPEPLRIELLQILVSLVNARPANGENLNCGSVVWIAPFFGEIERLMPQQWLVLRQAINSCQSASPQLQREINFSRDERLNTVESFLDAAADAKDLESRMSYKYRAASLADEHMDYELALKILDDMTTEERELDRESWNASRWNWATDGAIEHYKHNRFREMNLLLDGVPSDLQPIAKITFIRRLPEGPTSEMSPLIIAILNDVLKGLKQSNIRAGLKSEWWFEVLPFMIKYQPADANAVLKEAIASLNQLNHGLQLNKNELYKTLGPSLLGMDEFVVKDALASVTSVQTRTHLRLALLAATLQHVKN